MENIQSQNDDLYAILEMSSSASFEELKANYRKLVLQYHPDKVVEEEREACQSEFQRLDRAWKILSDPVLRHQYDAQQRADELTDILVNDEIDLQDMIWDEDDHTYFSPCRCGGDYTLSQVHASGSRIVNCSNCSLCIRVMVERQTNELDEITQKDIAKR